MTRLSIIIPVLGNPTRLDDTLVSVLENRPAQCEIIVVHTESYDDPYELTGEVRFLKARRKAGLAECLNMGLAASEGPIVHVLACGVEVSAGWADAAMRHFRDPQVAAVAGVVLHRDNHEKVVSAGLGYRAEGTAWRLGRGKAAGEVGQNADELRGPDTLAAFYRRSALETVGGFSPWAADTLAGIDVALALGHAGFRCASEPRCVVRADDAAVRETRFSPRPRRRAALLALGLGPRLLAFAGGPLRAAGRRMYDRPLTPPVDPPPVGPRAGE